MASKKYHSSRLAAHIGTMHLETMHYLDKQAEKAAKSVDRAIVAILELTKRKPALPQYQLEIEIARILDKLPNEIGQAVYDSLIKAGKRSAVNTVKALIKSLPLEYLPVGIAASGLNINAKIIQKPKRKPAFILTPTELKVRIHHLLIDPIEKETLQKIVLGGAKNISALMRQAKRQLNYRKVARILIDGTSKGKSYRQLQRDLQQELGITRSQAKRIARTEGARVSTESNFASYDKLGTAVIGFMIHATPNPDSRYWHRERSGTIYYKNPGPGQKGLRQMPKPPMEAEDPAERPPDAPPIAHNCILPGATIQGSFNGAVRSEYSGKAIEVICRSGARLSITPNHPICTSAGMIPAEKLKVGDKVLCTSGNINGNIVDGNECNVPTLIQDVFSTLKQKWSSSIKSGAAFNFHGDLPLRNSNVDVVSSERVLMDYVYSIFPELFYKLCLPLASVNSHFRSRRTSLHFDFNRIGLTSSCLLGHFRYLFFAIIRSISISSSLRFGIASYIDASLNKFSSKTKTSIGLSVNSATGYSKFLGQLEKRFATFITYDDIIEIRDFYYSGHVYDLQSPNGFIVANTMFISNCLCYISPVFAPLDNLKPNLVHNVDGTVVPDVLTYADWFQTQPERMKRKAVGSKRFDAVTKKHGDAAGYQYFVHPEDGRLLTLPEIAAETAQETSQRVALVNKITMERRRERRDVLLWGSVQ